MKAGEVTVPENLGPGLQSRHSGHRVSSWHSTSSLDLESEPQEAPVRAAARWPLWGPRKRASPGASTAASQGATHRSGGAAASPHWLEARALASVRRNECHSVLPGALAPSAAGEDTP